MESCTGGGVAWQLTGIAGSSDWFERGLVTYSNQAKTELAGVATGLIEQFGAVSIEVAEAMALGGLSHGRANCAVSVTGVAGPGGGSADKPVGTVCFGWAWQFGRDPARVMSNRVLLQGDRAAVRNQSIVILLEGILQHLPPAIAAADK